MAISFFGPKAINAFVLPLALDYWKKSEAMLSKCDDLEERMEIRMFEQATLNALGVFLGPNNRDAPEAMGIEWDELEDEFGDRLVMLCTNETEYATCFIWQIFYFRIDNHYLKSFHVTLLFIEVTGSRNALL